MPSAISRQRLRGWVSMRLRVYSTSEAVSGCPSENLTPFRRRKVYFSPSSETVQLSAREGTIFVLPFPSVWVSTRRSKTFRATA